MTAGSGTDLTGKWYLARAGRQTRPVFLRADGRMIGTGDRLARWAVRTVFKDRHLTLVGSDYETVLAYNGAVWIDAAQTTWLGKSSETVPASSQPLGRTAIPCLHLGRPTAPDSGASVTRSWFECDHPERPLGAKVCSCMGCGPKCRGYEADGDAAAEAPSLVLAGGIGDAFAIESVLTPDQRDSIETIYYNVVAAKEIRQLFRALPNYPRLKTHVTIPHGTPVTRAPVRKPGVPGSVPESAIDGSVGAVFPRHLSYTGSSFLTHTLARPERPAARYAVVVPASTWYAPDGRAFDAADWATCFRSLEAHNLTGVVLMGTPVPVPAHPRLLDLQGKTSILESVEILKAAEGYLGVDSCLSVLAAKLFPATKLSVKWHGDHLWVHRRAYYAPRTSFGWLTKKLAVPSWA